MSLNFSHPQVVLTEVPGEISLALSISGCPLRCKGCHSTFTHEPSYGSQLSTKILNKLIPKHVTCILFYGGEWDSNSLIELLTYVKSIGLKTCLYTGHPITLLSENLLNLLDFVKVNPYKQHLGGLESPITNQKFYYLSNGTITKEHKFYKE